MKVNIDTATTFKITLEMTETELRDLLADIKNVFVETELAANDLEQFKHSLVRALNNHKIMAD